MVSELTRLRREAISMLMGAEIKAMNERQVAALTRGELVLPDGTTPMRTTLSCLGSCKWPSKPVVYREDAPTLRGPRALNFSVLTTRTYGVEEIFDESELCVLTMEHDEHEAYALEHFWLPEILTKVEVDERRRR